MKILVHGISSNLGGLETFLLSTCTQILVDRKDVSFDFVLYGDEPSFLEPLIEMGCGAFCVTKRTESPLKNARQLDDVLKTGGYDLLWFNVNTLSDVTLLALAHCRGVKTIVHAHNSALMGSYLNKALHHIHRPLVSALSTMCVGCSDDAVRCMFSKKVYFSDRCRVLPNAIDCVRFLFKKSDRRFVRNDLGLSGSFVVGHTGRFVDQKNHEYLIRVFKEILLVREDAKLLLIGSGPLEEMIKNQVSELHLENKVIFLGSVKDIASYYSAMDSFVFPSRFEGFGLSLLEAQANGLRCVASDVIPSIAFAKKNAIALSLDEGPKKWAQMATENLPSLEERALAAKELEEAGYGIESYVVPLVSLMEEVIGK